MDHHQPRPRSRSRRLPQRPRSLVLCSLLLLLATCAPLIAQAEALPRTPYGLAASELAEVDRPAAVALTTSYTLLALTLRPLAAAEEAASSSTAPSSAAAPQPPATTSAEAGYSRAPRHTGQVIHPGAERFGHGWLVELALFGLLALAVIAGLIELLQRSTGAERPWRRTP